MTGNLDDLLRRDPHEKLMNPGFSILTIPKSGTFMLKKNLNLLNIPSGDSDDYTGAQ